MLRHAVAVAALALLALPAAAELVATTAQRTVDLATSGSLVVRESLLLELHNRGSGDIAEYHYAVAAGRRGEPIYIGAVQHTANDPIPLPVVDKRQDDAVTTTYTIRLAQPLASQSRGKIEVYAAFQDALHPLPREIAQAERQKLVFEDVVGLVATHPVQSVTTTVKLPSDQVESYTRTPQVDRRGRSIVYPDARADQPLRVHFTSPRAGLTCTRFRREVWVRWFGATLEVEEHATLAHQGAELKDHAFNRAALMDTRDVSNLHVIPELPLELPPGARNVYVVDEIGNVSTTHFSRRGQRSLLELRPRYPLWGGWQYNWWHGYAVDAEGVSSAPQGGYHLDVDLVRAIPSDVLIEDLEVRLVLPEGAQVLGVVAADTQAALPYTLDTTFYYLDTTGRATVVIRQHAVLPRDHATTVRVHYALAPWRYLQKSAAVVAFLVCAATLVKMLAGLDLSLSKRSADHAKRLADLLARRNRECDHLMAAHAAYTTSRNAAALQRAYDRATAEAGQHHWKKAMDLATTPVARDAVAAARARTDAALELVDRVLNPGDDADAARTQLSACMRAERDARDRYAAAWAKLAA